MLVIAKKAAHFPRAGLTLRCARVTGLQQDASHGLVVATGAGHLDRSVQIGLAVRELLSEGKRKTGLHQHVETPAFDFRSLVLWGFGDLGHEVPVLRSFLDEPCRSKFVFQDHGARNAPSRLDSASERAASSRRVRSRTRASKTARSASASAPIERICPRSSFSVSEIRR